MIIIPKRQIRTKQPKSAVDQYDLAPGRKWACVSVGAYQKAFGTANPTETQVGAGAAAGVGQGEKCLNISTVGDHLSYSSNAGMQLSSSSGIIVFDAPASATFALFTTSYTSGLNGFCIFVGSNGRIEIIKHDIAAMIVVQDVVVPNKLHKLAWSYNNVTGDCRLAIDGVLYKNTSAQTLYHDTVVRGRYYAESTAASGVHKQYLFALSPDTSISDAELIKNSINPYGIFKNRNSNVVFTEVGGGGADVTTSGSISTISLGVVTGAATGSATTSGSIGSISLSAAIGSATSSVSATADIEAVSLSAATGSATGSATATGAVNTVSLTAVTGTASAAGDVEANGAVSALSLSAATGAATGTAVVSGAVASVSINAVTGDASVSISAAGSISVISLTATTGIASTGGDVVATADFPALSISASTGAATGTATTSAAFAPISLSAATGTASAGADVAASGSIAVIGLTAPAGTATISIEAQAAISSVFMSAPTGVATGSAVCSGSMSAVSLTACRATASNGLENLGFLRQSVFVRSAEAREFARINTGSRYFSRRS